MGYHRAGFDVVGVDLAPQPHYPFEFHQADALEFVAEHGNEFDAIHASPPCQGYSIMRHLPWLKGKEYPLLIDPTRDALIAIGKPWVIENVMGAHLVAGWLCGTMFGLPFFRHRSFEVNGWLWLQPGHPRHSFVIRPGRGFGDSGDIAERRMVQELPWMTSRERRQAIPPTYTQFIGLRLMATIVASDYRTGQ